MSRILSGKHPTENLVCFKPQRGVGRVSSTTRVGIGGTESLKLVIAGEGTGQIGVVRELEYAGPCML